MRIIKPGRPVGRPGFFGTAAAAAGTAPERGPAAVGLRADPRACVQGLRGRGGSYPAPCSGTGLGETRRLRPPFAKGVCGAKAAGLPSALIVPEKFAFIPFAFGNNWPDYTI